MKPRITVITLGVEDLERALIFYRDGLGFPTQGIVGSEFEHGEVAFFDLQSGLKLAIWRRQDLAYEAKVEQRLPNPAEFTLGHNVASKEAVDHVMDQAKRAGAHITDPAQTRFGVGTQDISKTRMDTCGRSCGTRSGSLMNEVGTKLV